MIDYYYYYFLKPEIGVTNLELVYTGFKSVLMIPFSLCVLFRLFGSKCSNSKPSSPDSSKSASFVSPLDSPGSGGNRTPDSLSNTRPFLSSSSAGSKETLSSIHTSSHTSLHTSSHTSLHTSSESIELPAPHHQHAPRLKSTLSQGYVWYIV